MLKVYVKIEDLYHDGATPNVCVMKGRDILTLMTQAFEWGYRHYYQHFCITIARDADFKSILDSVECERC